MVGRPGFPPNIGTNRTDALFTEVVDLPFSDGLLHTCPQTSIIGRENGKSIVVQTPEETKTRWNIIVQLPHAILWRPGDWVYLEDLSRLKTLFYLGLMSTAGVAEIRHREDVLGCTRDALVRLRIRYVDSTITKPSLQLVEEPAKPNVVHLDRRRLLLDESFNEN